MAVEVKREEIHPRFTEIGTDQLRRPGPPTPRDFSLLALPNAGQRQDEGQSGWSTLVALQVATEIACEAAG